MESKAKLGMTRCLAILFIGMFVFVPAFGSGQNFEKVSSNLILNPIEPKTVYEGKTLSFIASVTDNSLDGLTYSLEKNPPSGASIDPNSGQFIWTPSASQGNTNGIQYNFDIVLEKGTQKDSESITITVKDPVTSPPKELGIAPFVDPDQDPQYYVDRYNNEPSYKKWFDDNFSEYDSIYQAVGLDEPLAIPAPFVDPDQDPQYYVDRYNNELSYKKWFDDNFSEYDSIYQAVGLIEPTQSPPTPPAGTDVVIPQGTSVPGCEKTTSCYVPYSISIQKGETVTWFNQDSAAHTVTTGTGAGGPTGVFDSSLFMAGTTFSHKFESVGEFPYFCMIHPWMEGEVNVIGFENIPEPKPKIPEWVRNIFIWYAEDRISEDELIESLEFLIREGILKV